MTEQWKKSPRLGFHEKISTGSTAQFTKNHSSFQKNRSKIWAIIFTSSLESALRSALYSILTSALVPPEERYVYFEDLAATDEEAIVSSESQVRSRCVHWPSKISVKETRVPAPPFCGGVVVRMSVATAKIGIKCPLGVRARAFTASLSKSCANWLRNFNFWKDGPSIFNHCLCTSCAPLIISNKPMGRLPNPFLIPKSLATYSGRDFFLKTKWLSLYLQSTGWVLTNLWNYLIDPDFYREPWSTYLDAVRFWLLLHREVSNQLKLNWKM